MSQVATNIRAIPGPDSIARTVLDNGLVTLVRENQSAPIVVLQGSLPGGAALEPAAQAGLASFTASLLARGSTAYDFAAFNETVEAVGGNVTFGADTHSIEFGITCLAEDFQRWRRCSPTRCAAQPFRRNRWAACASSGWYRCKNAMRTPPASPICVSMKASLAALTPTDARRGAMLKR